MRSDNFALELAFEVSLLCRRQVAIEDDDIDRGRFHLIGEFAYLAGPDQRGRLRRLARLKNPIDDLGPRTICQDR